MSPTSVQLFNADCFEVFPQVTDKSVDLILCDLPYGTTKNKWDTQIPMAKLWEQYERIIKDNGVIVLFAQTPFDKLLGTSNIKMLRYEWVWEKAHGTGHLNAKKAPMKKHENILVFYKNQPTYNPQMTEGKPYTVTMRAKNASKNYDKQKDITTISDGKRYPTSILSFKSDIGLHPTQKPLALCEYFIKTYTNEGDLVLDNCMGSGTTGVASAKLRRHFIGVEKEQCYFEVAKQRTQKIMEDFL